MPLIETKGAASAQGFGEFAKSGPVNYIEDVFSTYLYTGTGSTQTITNGIDLAGKGGLVWVKSRDVASGHFLYDTSRGVNQYLASNTTAASANYNSSLTAFNSNGFTLGFNLGNVDEKYASWTFRKQPKFFDVVTWTGTFVTNRRISHSLGSVPGFIVVKRTDSAGQWWAYHRSLGRDKYLQLQGTNAAGTSTDAWGTSDPTTTDFGFNEQVFTPASGGTYVAYLFAHDAGGFGLSGSDNVISCGSYTGNGSSTGPVITLGWEPQWVLIKNASDVGNWVMSDNMRNWSVTNAALLYANLSNAEATNTNTKPTATGFQPNDTSSSVNTNGATYIYIAIRRGPMKVPTSGTSVFAPLTRSTNGVNTTITTSLTTVDMVMYGDRNGVFGTNAVTFDRLRGNQRLLRTSQTSAENSDTTAMTGFDVQKGYSVGTDTNGFGTNYNIGGPYPVVNWQFGRAPGFFDIVCYTGTGVARTINHNLAAVPELMIVRRRSSIANWAVNSQSLTASDYLYLNSTDPKADNTSPIIWNSTRPTSTVFSVGTSALTNENAQTFVAYLFATVAGVSKVGSYTGNGSSQTINCGFTAGARFVLIKRTDSTGNWLVADSARGIVAGNDPLLYLNSTAAEITTLDWIDADSSGFIVNQEATANANVSSATYIYFAVA